MVTAKQSSFLGCLVLSFWVLLTWSPLPPCNAEVVHLTDQTFEHQTQASTGGTTGSWLVLFGIPTCVTCRTLRPHLEELSHDADLYENGIVIGSVDCTESPIVCKRFGIGTLPTLLYLRRKVLYRVPKPLSLSPPPPHDGQQQQQQQQQQDNPQPSGEDNDGEEEDAGSQHPPQPPTVVVETLKSFVLRDYHASSEGEAVPDPPSAFDSLVVEPLATVYGAMRENTLLAIAVLLMSTMLVLTLGVLVVALASSKKSPSSSGGGGDKSKKKD
jgi:thiol-disulfide isomerase/thioredoxin